MISAAQGKGFYRSVSDVPEPLRGQLLRVTTSENSGTIVIADRAGKAQLTHVVARREAAKGRSAKAVASTLPVRRAERLFLGFSWIVWAGVFLVLGSAGVIAAVFTIRW
jgi:hypothetical protein